MKDGDFKGAAAFAYRDSMPREVWNNRQVLLGDVDQMYMSDEKDCSNSSVSKNRIDVEMTEEGMNLFAWWYGQTTRQVRRLRSMNIGKVRNLFSRFFL